MSKKSLIACLVILAMMIAGIGVALYVLYSGTGNAQKSAAVKVGDQSKYLLLPAVPSDAVMLCCFSDAQEGLNRIYGGTDFHASLKESKAKLGKMTVSLHFSGKLASLYIFDAGKAANQPSAEAELIMETARGCGMYAEYQDCSTTGSKFPIADRAIVIVSKSENLVKSSLRHLQKAVSIIDAPGFAEASVCASSSNAIFMPNAVASKIMSSVLTSEYNHWMRFASKLSDWTALDLNMSGNETAFSGSLVSDGDLSFFASLFERTGASSSKLSAVLPSNTLSAATLPLKDVAKHISEYQTFLDARQALQANKAANDNLEKATGIAPMTFFTRLDAKEAATAAIMIDGNVERVNLVRVAKPDTLKNCIEKAYPYNYSTFASAVFGNLFKLPNESSFAYINGWIVSGSETAVEAYASGKVLTYTLKEHMVNAGLKDMFSEEAASFMAYQSVSENAAVLSKTYKAPVLNIILDQARGADYSGFFLTAGQNKFPYAVSLSMFRKEVKKSKPIAPTNITVTVPTGPFKVKNSGTGKMNIFYQQENLYLCLQEENGKGLWGVPFPEPICGTAQTIDYYANGKLQILFGAGTKIHLIDRLGRFVKGFPVDLKKEILIGPDVYDFNGTRRYNVMVLHKDNTIEMYNLKGQKPESWKGISAPEIVRGLPERIIVAGNTYWVVRTSVQTLIYPFGGGEPVTQFTGDQMALPDSEVKVIDGSAIELSCYDGKSRSVKLK